MFCPLLFACGAVWLFYHFYWKRKDFPPGPLPVPFLGNMQPWNMAWITNPCAELRVWAAKYGPVYTFWLGGDPAVALTDFDVFKETIVKNGAIYTDRYRNFLTKYFFGSERGGIVMADGALWREQRRFTLHSLRNFGFGRNVMEQKILIEMHKGFEQLEEEIKTSQTGDAKSLDDFVNTCIGGIINRLLFGRGFDSYGQFLRLKGLLDNNFKLMLEPRLMLVGIYSWLRYLPGFSSLFNQLRSNREQLAQFFAAQLEEHKTDFDENAEATDFTAAYLHEMHRRKATGQSMEHFSEQQLLFVCSDLWFAGLETTVTTLRWAFLYMIRFPEVQRKVQEELDQNVDSDTVRTSDKTSLPYTLATIQEIQRYANILPFPIARRLSQDTTVAGHRLRRGTTIMAQTSLTAGDERYFSRPHEFDPMHFLETDGKTLRKVEQFVPFSMGKRSCVGESLATMELFLIFANFLRKFEIGVPEGTERPSLQPVVGISLTPAKYKCSLKLR